MSDEKQGRFWEIVNQSNDDLEIQRLALLERTVRRQIASAHDSAVGQVIANQQRINDLLGGLRHKASDGLNVNLYAELKLKARRLEEAQVDMGELHEELFATDLPTL